MFPNMNFEDVESYMRIPFIILNTDSFHEGRDCCCFYCFGVLLNFKQENIICLMSGGLKM